LKQAHIDELTYYDTLLPEGKPVHTESKWAYNGKETKSIDLIASTGMVRGGQNDRWITDQMMIGYLNIINAPLGLSRNFTISRFLEANKQSISYDTTSSLPLLKVDVGWMEIYFDPAVGYAPTRQVAYIDATKQQLLSELTASKFMNFAGVSIPMELDQNSNVFEGSLLKGTYKMQTTIENIKVNIDIPDAEFNLEIPKHASYIDQPKGIFHSGAANVPKKRNWVLYAIILAAAVVALLLLRRRLR
jgi:hypothetical protein